MLVGWRPSRLEAIASKRPSSLVGRRPLVGWRPSRFEVIASNVGWRPSGSLKSGYLRITLCYTFIPSLRVQPFAMHATLRLQKKQINPSQKKEPFAMLSTLRYAFNPSLPIQLDLPSILQTTSSMVPELLCTKQVSTF